MSRGTRHVWCHTQVTLVAWGCGYQGRQGSGGPIWAGHPEVPITSAQDGSQFLLSVSEEVWSIGSCTAAAKAEQWWQCHRSGLQPCWDSRLCTGEGAALCEE